MRASLVCLLLLLGSAPFCAARTAQNKPNIQPSDDPALATWIIIGVVAATTFAVLIVLIPTLLYYKHIAARNTTIDVIKK